MSVKRLTEHHIMEFLSLKGGCTGSYESTLVKIPHCWKSHVTAHLSNCHRDEIVNYIIFVMHLTLTRLKGFKWAKVVQELVYIEDLT